MWKHAYSLLCNVVTRGLCDHHQSQGAELPSQEPLSYSFTATITSGTPSLSGNDWSVLQLYNFVFSKMLYKWSHTYVIFWNWIFFSLIIIPLRSIQVVCINSSFLFIAKWYSMVWIYHSFNIHPLKDIWVIYSFELWTNKTGLNVYRFLCEHKFLFL